MNTRLIELKNKLDETDSRDEIFQIYLELNHMKFTDLSLDELELVINMKQTINIKNTKNKL